MIKKIFSRNYKIDLSIKQLICFILIISIVILILLRDISGLGISKWVFIGLSLSVCVLSNKYYIYCFIALITPLSSGISSTYIVAIALVIILIKQNKRIQWNFCGVICLLAIMIIEILSGFRGMFSIFEYIRFIGVFIFSFLMIIDLDTNYQYEKMINYYIIGFWVAMASILGQMLNVYNLSEILTLGVRFGNTRQILNMTNEGMIIYYNPNGLSTLALQTIFLCLLQFKKTKKNLYLLSFFGALLFGIMTQSRTFILALIICTLLYFAFSCRNIKSAFKAVVVFISTTFLSINILYAIVPNYINQLLLRFQSVDISNGRTDIMSFYFEEMFKHIDRLILGVGLQSYSEKYNFDMSAHNATQEVLIIWGIIGLFIVVLLFAVGIKVARKKNPNITLVQYVPLLATLIILQSGQGFLDRSGMLRMTIMFAVLCIPISNLKYSNRKQLKQ